MQKPTEHFDCPKLSRKASKQVRFDICINRFYEGNRKPKCTDCDRIKEIIKTLVQDIL